MIDLNAPITPGCSAAGLGLGDPVDQIGRQPLKRERRGRYELLNYGSVVVWLHAERIAQIGVSGGYRGLLRGTIGIGSTIREIGDALGSVTEDEQDNLVVDGLPGLCFETEKWRGMPGRETVEGNLDARVTEIYVFVGEGAS